MKQSIKPKIAENNFQQGDVTGVKLTVMPEGEARVVSRRKCVLAEGETTGHAHRIESEDAELIQIGERMLLRLEKAATVTHEEHGAIHLSPGIWEIGRVQEYDYFSKMARQVAD